MSNFCHIIKPFYQPYPTKEIGGDCFACCLTAVLQHLFPENPPNFETVWNYFMQKIPNSDKTILSCSWMGLKDAIVRAASDGYNIEHIYDLVLPNYYWEKASYCFYAAIPNPLYYTRRLEGWLRSGWIAITEINFNGDYAYLNHNVVLDGAAEQDTPLIHVVCSVKGAYWIDATTLLKKHGAAGWWLIRKK